MNVTARMVSGLAWTGAGRLLSQLVAWAASIFVIRILDPGDYGLLAMAAVVTGFVALFAELGLGWAVVQARQVDEMALRALLGLVILVNGTFLVLLWSSAPLVATYFGEERLVLIIRVMGLQLLLAVPGVIPDAMLQRRLEFKWRSFVMVTSSTAAAATTLLLALNEYGVWALVFGSMAAAACRSLGLNLLHPFIALPRFSFRGLETLFAFGGYVAASRAFLYFCLQADVVIGGRFLGKDQLGYYAVAMQLASLPMQRISSVLNEVAFPAFARLQHDPKRLATVLLRAIATLGLLAVPVFWGIAAVAPEIVLVILGAKWHDATLPLQVLALVMPLRMVGQLMPPALQGMGQARLVAANQLFACCAMTIAFIAAVPFGILGLSMAWLLAYPLVFVVQLRSWLPLAGVGAKELVVALSRPAVAGAGMMAAVAALRPVVTDTGLLGLVTLVSAGATAYTLCSLLVNREALMSLASFTRAQH